MRQGTEAIANAIASNGRENSLRFLQVALGVSKKKKGGGGGGNKSTFFALLAHLLFDAWQLTANGVGDYGAAAICHAVKQVSYDFSKECHRFPFPTH